MSCINFSGGRNPIILPHHKFSGVYVDGGGDDNNNTIKLYTKNLIPGQGNKNDNGEYRRWDPMKCKLASAILSGAQKLWITPGARVLIVYPFDYEPYRIEEDEPYGRTISHISDIVGPDGIVHVVDQNNGRDLANLADKRFNIVPIIHSILPVEYRMLINMVDVLFADIDNPNQTSCNVSTNLTSMEKEEQNQFNKEEEVTLERFDRDYTYVVAAFRLLEMADPSCFRNRPHWVSQLLNRPAGAPYLPTYMLLETSCGYALILVDDMYEVECNYKAIEEYFDRFHAVLVAYHPFISAQEALAYFSATCSCTGIANLPEEFIEFTVRNLPTPKVDGQYRYIVACPPNVGFELTRKTHVASKFGLFLEEIFRGIRMHVDKIINDIKPGDMEKAQLVLARNYCKEKLNASSKRGLKEETKSERVKEETKRGIGCSSDRLDLCHANHQTVLLLISYHVLLL